MTRVLAVRLDPAMQQALLARTAGEPALTWHEIDETAQLAAMLDADPAPDAVVLGPGVANPLQMAQQLHALRGDLAVVILAEEPQAAALRRALPFTSGLGDTVTIQSPGDGAAVAAALRQVVWRTQQRRQFRATVAALNERLATAPPSPPRIAPYLDRLLELAPIGVLVLDAEDRVAAGNRAAREIFADGRGALLGRPALTLFPSRAHPRLQRLLARARAADGAPQRARVSGRRRQPPCWLELTVAGISGPGDAPGLLLLCQDISAQVQAERAREHALAAARAAVAVREQFLTSAAHELRTPLTPLRGILQLLRRQIARGVPPVELSAALDRAQRQVERLTRLVERLLDVSRLGTHPLELADEPVALGSVVAQAVELAQAADPSHPIGVALPERSPIVRGDAVRLEQALLHLLENARMYSPTSTPIDVHLSADDEHVIVAVRDQGIGVPVEDQPYIFDRFHRGGNITRNMTGFGLGLHLAREIVTAHGGTLTVQSVPGAGSTFTLTLPRGDATSR